MSITATRRDVLKFIGGSAAGILLTPAPWKLLDDTAIWTQTGPWIARVPRGAKSVRYTTCTLCPAACGLRVRSVQGTPYQTGPVSGHPLSSGAICPVGTAAHHSAFHPLRLKSPVRITGSQSGREVSPANLDEIIGNLRRKLGEPGTIAIADLRPGRTASLFYRKLLKAVSAGRYIVGPSDESTMFEGLRALLRSPVGTFGADVEHADLVVSFGVPLLEQWGTPGRTSIALKKTGQKVIQIGPALSRSALLADEWIPARPGADGILALSLAHVLIREHLYDRGAKILGRQGISMYRELAAEFAPEEVAEISGVPAVRIVSLAREMASRTPSLVLGGPNPGTGSRPLEEEMAVWGLNLLLGSVGRPGGIVTRREVPAPAGFTESSLAVVGNLGELPDESVSILIIDASQSGPALPWTLVERKLKQERLVVTLTQTLSGTARYSDYAVPTAAPLELLSDTVTPGGSLNPSFGIAAPILPQVPDAVDPVAFAGAVFGTPGTTELLLKTRVAAIQSAGRGKVFVPSEEKTVEVREIFAADDLATLLLEGGIWFDEEVPRQRELQAVIPRQVRSFMKLRKEEFGRRKEGDLLLVLEGKQTAISQSQLPPILSKVCQESNLWTGEGTALMNPRTAAEHGFGDGDPVVVETKGGSLRATVRCNSGIMPGIVQMSTGLNPVLMGEEKAEFSPEAQDLQDLDASGGAGLTPVVLRKA